MSGQCTYRVRFTQLKHSALRFERTGVDEEKIVQVPTETITIRCLGEAGHHPDTPHHIIHPTQKTLRALQG